MTIRLAKENDIEEIIGINYQDGNIRTIIFWLQLKLTPPKKFSLKI